MHGFLGVMRVYTQLVPTDARVHALQQLGSAHAKYKYVNMHGMFSERSHHIIMQYCSGRRRSVSLHPVAARQYGLCHAR